MTTTINQIEIELVPATGICDIVADRNAYGEPVRVSWLGQDGWSYIARLEEDADEDPAWALRTPEVEPNLLGYISPDTIREAGGWLRILADGATVTGYTLGGTHG